MISCEDVKAMQLCQEDVFLHKNDFDGKPIIGEEVKFTLSFDDFGKPKATNARFIKNEMLTLTEWMAQRSSKNRS